MRLTVKGDAGIARRELARRGIHGTIVGWNGTETYCDNVPEDARAAVIAWFCEPTPCVKGEGFPPGTLLFHS